ncbi:MAG: pyridoxamine 5'-phosphate oxidase [Verrucomicrobiota bacterium]
MKLTAFRKEYTLAGLRRRDLAENPTVQFQEWFEQAVQAEVPEPTAMSLATVNELRQPSVRTVLLKAVDERGFIFCTNYESQKGQELAENSNAALLFFWKELERQVSIRGVTRKVPVEESDAYFKVRPVGSQLGAWVSKQSSVVENRETLERKFQELEKEYSGQQIPLPPNWGGYVVAPVTIEFWQGRVNRLHDRFLYTKQANGKWMIERLSP